jgi:hypothetical protein
MPVMPAPTTTTSTFTFFSKRGNRLIGALSIQKGTFLIHGCSHPVRNSAVHEKLFETVSWARRDAKTALPALFLSRANLQRLANQFARAASSASDSALEEYKKALDDHLSPSLYELVSRQYSDIKAAHDRIRNLRDTAKNC